MPVTIPIEAYEELEKGLGKEGAKKVVKALESVISEATEYKWKVSKEEILDAMRKEFDNMRGEFNGQSNSLRSEFNGLRSEFNGHLNSLRSEFDGLRNELRKEFVTKELFVSELKRVEMKLNFLIILMIIALTLMNPVMAEIIKGLLKL
ncbi:MAG: hypothetical protein WA240_13145 [Nitrospirota bacterium]